jgi:conjugal transfer/entry exclusion protein
MTETEATAAPELPIEFRGREMFVTMPSPEQLMVWQRTLHNLQNADAESWDGPKVMKTLERSRKIVDSLLVNEEDIEWLDDEMISGRVDLKGTVEIIQKATEAFSELAASQGNREERRAAAKKAPAKKVTRKALPR